MKKWLIRLGLWTLRFLICYAVLYFMTVYYIKPGIPDNYVSFFCWLTALISADLGEIKDMLDKDGKGKD